MDEQNYNKIMSIDSEGVFRILSFGEVVDDYEIVVSVWNGFRWSYPEETGYLIRLIIWEQKVVVPNAPPILEESPGSVTISKSESNSESVIEVPLPQAIDMNFMD